MSGKKTGAATPTGDAAFDEEIEVLGASAALREALGDSELKALVRRVVLELGAVAVHNDIVLERPRASAATTLRADLDAMIRLARWLNEPNASKLSHIEAPLVPRFAGLGEDGEIPADAVREFLEEVGSSIGAGQLASDGDAPQWRGNLGGNPFRIRIDDGDVHAELKIANPMGNLELYWDPDEIPERTPETQQVWDEEDAPVFVGRGVTISRAYSIGQDPDAVLPQRIAQWARLPDDTKAAVVATMSECDVHELVIDSAGIKAELRRKLGELFQPERSVVELARGLESIAKGLSGVQGTEGASPGAGVKIVPLNRETCAYCRSVFVWTTNAECPNCGAPVQA